MDDFRKKISQFTLKLQSQNHLPLWALANENVIYATAIGEKVSWGPQTEKLRKIIYFAYKMHISDIILFLVGLYQSFFIWWKVKKKYLKTRKLTQSKKIFAGFGAASEEYLYADYLHQSKESTLRINWVTQSGLHELGCPNFFSILRMLARNAFCYTARLKKSTPDILSNAIDFLVGCALNIGVYSFYRAYWQMAKLRGVKEVTFLAPDMPAFACVDVGIKSIFMQHGLIALSILVPKVNRIDVLTSDEERYFKATSKDIQISRPDKKNKTISKNDVCIFLPPSVIAENDMPSVMQILQWAIKKNLEVIVRPTPIITKENLLELNKQLHYFIFDDLNISLDESLVKWNPKCVVSWRSTGLATALDYECMPISLFDPSENLPCWNMIYPMNKRVLFWPRDESLIEQAIQSENEYYEQLKKLQVYQDQLCH